MTNLGCDLAVMAPKVNFSPLYYSVRHATQRASIGVLVTPYLTYLKLFLLFRLPVERAARALHRFVFELRQALARIFKVVNALDSVNQYTLCLVAECRHNCQMVRGRAHGLKTVPLQIFIEILLNNRAVPEQNPVVSTAI